MKSAAGTISGERCFGGGDLKIRRRNEFSFLVSPLPRLGLSAEQAIHRHLRYRVIAGSRLVVDSPSQRLAPFALSLKLLEQRRDELRRPCEVRNCSAEASAGG